MATYTEIGSTVLPKKSCGPNGSLYFKHLTSKYGGSGLIWEIQGSFNIDLYCTSRTVRVTSSDLSQWRYIGTKYFNCMYSDPLSPPTSGAMFNFTSPHFSRASALAIYVNKSTGEYQRTIVDPIQLTYATISPIVISSGSAMGKYYYFATDGGYAG
jgi:hypothetical protein